VRSLSNNRLGMGRTKTSLVLESIHVGGVKCLVFGLGHSVQINNKFKESLKLFFYCMPWNLRFAMVGLEIRSLTDR
jgi:hypothetical protein